MNTRLLELLTNTAGMSYNRMIFALALSALISIYIFFVYRVITKNAFYSKSYNMTMALMSIITTGIVIAMQSNLVISLGMVGALSIVRFRTAVKDPMDLLFIFWSVGVGIICGSQLYGLAVVLSAMISVLLFLLEYVPIKKPPYLLIINSIHRNEEDIVEMVSKYAKGFKIKSRNMTSRGMDLIIELRTNQEKEMLKSIQGMGVEKISLISHDGETRF